MKDKRIYMVHIDDIPENESFTDWSDERVIQAAEKRGTVYTLRDFCEQWNESTSFIASPEFSYIRLLDKPKAIIGYQVYKDSEIPNDMPDWWVFYTKEDALKFAEWAKYEDYTIEEVLEGEIYEPEFMTFEEYIRSCVFGNLSRDGIIIYSQKNNESYFDYVLGWLKDFGIPKPLGVKITNDVLKIYEL